MPKRVIISQSPYFPQCLPDFQAQLRTKANGKGTALKGQRPYPEKEKAAPVHSFCNTQPTLPYAVPLSSAALRYSAQSCNSTLL